MNPEVLSLIKLAGVFAIIIGLLSTKKPLNLVMSIASVVVVVLYALCMALVFFSRDRKRRRAEEASADAPNESAVGTDSVSVPEIDSTLDACCASVAREGGLTEREAEILAYLARGRTKAYIADALFVTENTVRSHVRNIYSKLDVHTRQELLDLLER